MNRWEIAILQIIKAGGGCLSTQQIYKELETGRFIDLKEHHLEGTIYGNRPAYQHQVRSHLSNLCRANDLQRVERGIYAVTKKGLKRLKRCLA